jgi:single-strand DNA-binding protein
MNVVILNGVLSRPAELRVLPSGDTLVAYEVTTRDEQGRADTVPVTWATAQGKGIFDAGEAVVVTGRVRRRYFRAGGATQSRTEVVADAVVRAAEARRAQRAMDKAVAAVTG